MILIGRVLNLFLLIPAKHVIFDPHSNFCSLPISLFQNWYCLSKTLAEMEAFEYAKRTGVDVVSVCPSLVIGPLLQPTLNASSAVVVDFLKGLTIIFFPLMNSYPICSTSCWL